MKRLFSMLLCFGLLALFACGRRDAPAAATADFNATETETAEKTTVETTVDAGTSETVVLTTSAAAERTTAKPASGSKKAVMEPKQGGLYYYTYTGRNSKIGIIDQDGEVIAEPQFDRHYGDPVSDASGRAVGLVMGKGNQYVICYFDGTVKQIKEKILYFGSVYQGGRYAEINPLNASSSGCGIYDLQEGKYVVEPKAGQSIGWNASGILFTEPYDENERQWIFNINDGSLRQAPEHIRGLWHHYPNMDWYETYLVSKNHEHRYYDSNFNELAISLQGWKPSWNDTFEGEYETIGRDNEAAFINRKGEIVREGMYESAYAGYRRNFFTVTEKDGSIVWLDGNLHELGRLKKGEGFVGVNGPGNPAGLHIDAKGNVIRAIGSNFETLRNDAIYIAYEYSENIWEQSQVLYRIKDGRWTKLDLQQYLEKGKYQSAHAVVQCQDFVVVCVQQPGSWEKLANQPTVANMSLSTNSKPQIAPMTSYYIPPDVVEIFAVDWNGKRIENCPFEPYYKGAAFYDANYVLPNVGWPYHGGPHYFWVEANGKRGYVNIEGEWVFIGKR